MRVPRPVWRHTSVFFVGQLLTLLCCALLFVHWHYTYTSSPAASALVGRPPAGGAPPSAAAADPARRPGFWREASAMLRPFAGAALLTLLGSSALFAGCELLRSRPPGDKP